MNPQQPTNEHLLFVRGTHWNHGMSPSELQRVMTDFYAWVEGLSRDGILRGAQPLMEEGKLVTGAKGASVTDGVFAESKEAIAGYVESLEAHGEPVPPPSTFMLEGKQPVTAGSAETIQNPRARSARRRSA